MFQACSDGPALRFKAARESALAPQHIGTRVVVAVVGKGAFREEH